MKLRIFMLFVLMLTLSVSAVYAQDTVTEEVPAQEAPAEEAPAEEGSLDGFLKSLFGNVLEEVLPAGTDLDGMISAAGEQLGQAESELGSVFSTLIETAKSEGISVSVDSLKDYAVSFLSEMGGAGDFSLGADLDAYMAVMESIRAVEEQYYKDHNAGQMDPGEIQIVSNFPLFTEEHADFADYSAKETRTINYLTQLNFVKNEANQLVFVSGCSDVVMFTVRADEAGNFSVVSAKFSEDGENYKPSIEAMLAEAGAADTIEDIMGQIDFGRVMVTYDLKQSLTEHPEYTAVEYGGEMRTAEDLDVMWGEDLNAMYAEAEAEAEPAPEPAPAE